MRLRDTDVTWREIDGEMVILDLAASTYLTTNRTGTFLLRQLVVECSHDELVAALTTEFQVDRETASHDVSAFLDLLRQRRLLVESTVPAAHRQ